MAHDEAELSQRLKGIIDYVRDCQGRVNKGEIMDLQGLDKNVMEVCNAIAAMPREQGQKFEKQMSQLIAGLEELSHAIKEQHEEQAK